VKFITPTKSTKSAKEANFEDKVKNLQASNTHTDATTKAIVNNDKTEHFPESAISNNSFANREKEVVCDEEAMQWFASTKSTCRLALQNFQLRSKLVDSESRLTPNCALLKFEGSSQLTVDQVLKRQKEFLTSYGLDVTSVRPEAGFVSISIARPKRQILMLEDVMRDWKPKLKNSHCDLLIGIKEANNSILTLSPRKNAPHTLIAGSTGSGKSILLQNIILSIVVASKPDDVEVKIIDPKRVSFNKFKSLPHIKGDIIKDMDDAAAFLNSLLEEMKRRYAVLEKHEVEDIYELKQKTNIVLPIIWVLHDEFALWMLNKGYRDTVETVVNQLSVAARAAGIFLIFAAQRPDNNVFPMQLRANLGNRLVLKVDGPGTSDIALGEKNLGAEKLLGNGHIIAKLEGETEVIYAQVPFIGTVGVEDLIQKVETFGTF